MFQAYRKDGKTIECTMDAETADSIARWLRQNGNTKLQVAGDKVYHAVHGDLPRDDQGNYRHSADPAFPSNASDRSVIAQALADFAADERYVTRERTRARELARICSKIQNT